eukprot:scaffold7354_cov95-Amphora_coffeaeformis.AAC.2
MAGNQCSDSYVTSKICSKNVVMTPSELSSMNMTSLAVALKVELLHTIILNSFSSGDVTTRPFSGCGGVSIDRTSGMESIIVWYGIVLVVDPITIP